MSGRSRVATTTDTVSCEGDEDCLREDRVTFSIVIPTRFRALVLARTLDALSNQTDQNFEVVVVCDGPDPETERLAKTCDLAYRLEWIFAPAQQGCATARNSGANAARGDYLLFLDDDTVPVPCWLSIHREKQTAVGTRRLVVIGRVIDVFSRDPLNERERLLRKLRRDSSNRPLPQLGQLR